MTKSQIVELRQAQIKESEKRVSDLKIEIESSQQKIEASKRTIKATNEAIWRHQWLLKEIEKIEEPPQGMDAVAAELIAFLGADSDMVNEAIASAAISDDKQAGKAQEAVSQISEYINTRLTASKKSLDEEARKEKKDERKIEELRVVIFFEVFALGSITQILNALIVEEDRQRAENKK